MFGDELGHCSTGSKANNSRRINWRIAADFRNFQEGWKDRKRPVPILNIEYEELGPGVVANFSPCSQNEVQGDEKVPDAVPIFLRIGNCQSQNNILGTNSISESITGVQRENLSIGPDAEDLFDRHLVST
jgi:hypothetical protein